MGKGIDHSGQRFGRLVVQKRAKNSKYNERRWICLCDCGDITIVPGRALREQASSSCGCLRYDTSFKHGFANTKIYGIWRSMRHRCRNPNDRAWRNYGGRGVKVCERWHEFTNFLADMGEPPSPNLYLDRIDNNGDYEPSNCRWSTWREQQNNKRNNHLVTFNGRTQTITMWAEEIGIRYSTLWSRIVVYKLPIEEALYRPVKQVHSLAS